MTERKIVVRKLSDEDRRKMAEVATQVIDLVKERLDNDKLLMIQTIGLLHNGFMEENAVHAIKTVNKDGKDAKFDKLQFIHKMLTGMSQCSTNIILFRDCPEVWMQYHASIFLKIPVYIIALEKHRKALAYVYAEHIEFIEAEEYTAENIEGATATIMEEMKANE